MEAVQKTNYRPNVLAKSLKMGRSNTICLMVPSIQNLIFPEIARGVEDVARRNGFTVVLCNTDEDAAVDVYKRQGYHRRHFGARHVRSGRRPGSC